MGVVAHHADVLVDRAQLLDDEVLCEVGVLVLVHEDVPEAVLVFAQQVREVAKQHVHLVQQVVKIHGACTEAPRLVVGEDFSEHGPAGLLVFRSNLGVLGVRPRVDQVVLGAADAALHACGLVHLVVETHALDDVLQQAAAVLRVVDGEVSRVVDALAFHPKDAGEDAVKRPHPEVARLALPDEGADAVLHLLGRLVRERQGQNRERIHPLRHHVCDAVGQNPGLSRARTCNHHHGPFHVGRRLPLDVVEIF